MAGREERAGAWQTPRRRISADLTAAAKPATNPHSRHHSHTRICTRSARPRAAGRTTAGSAPLPACLVHITHRRRLSLAGGSAQLVAPAGERRGGRFGGQLPITFPALKAPRAADPSVRNRTRSARAGRPSSAALGGTEAQTGVRSTEYLNITVSRCQSLPYHSHWGLAPR